MAKLTNVLEIAGTTRNAFNHWHRNNLLTTKFAKTTPGVALELSRENALDIAFMTALTQIGYKPDQAKPFVQKWLQDERDGTLKPYWASTYGQRTISVSFSDDCNFHEINKILKEASEGLKQRGSKDLYMAPATALSILTLGEMVSKIDSLFKVELNNE